VKSRAWELTGGERGAAVVKQTDTFLTVPKCLQSQHFRLDPVWDPIRKDPRFERLVKNKKL
jgi:hypothetical protein